MLTWFDGIWLSTLEALLRGPGHRDWFMALEGSFD
jgi:hypothetical protein